MIYCYDCKEFSGEAETKEFVETHREVDTNRIEYTIEEVCPCCGSDHLKEAQDCPCGNLTANDFCDICLDCVQDRISEIQRRRNLGYKDTLDLVACAYERSN